jgi:TonB family protein
MINYWFFILALTVTAAHCADSPAASLPANEEEVVSPRLLKMVKPVYPPELAAQGIRADVLLKIDINAQGRVEKATVLKSNNPAFDEPSIKAILAWTFQPATHKGVPVPITATQGIKDREAVVPPRVLKKVMPFYPSELADLGVRAEVLLEIDINAQGRVERATVLKSNNPAFDEPSIKAVLDWTFQPATHEGVPIAFTALQSIHFYIQDDPSGGVDLFVVKSPKRSKDAAALRYVSPKPAGVVQAVYPYPLLLEKKSGKANVQLSVDKRGRVVKVQVLKASASEFGFAASAAAEQFTFNPATATDLPVESIVSVDVKFELFGENSVVRPPDKRLLKIETKKPDRIINAHQLDQPLKIISQKAAVFPVSLGTTFSKGEAMVEFLIDEKGAVALPRIISADAPEFGYAAVQAVSVWMFAPPVSKGEKVITKARVPFKFQYAAAPPTSLIPTRPAPPLHGSPPTHPLTP